ncbi:MAG: TSUP family transporter [Candidatus Marinarcus sp.]|uniref:TSUP family transporter n=1 Tax=Candidatus Marinarcus sp. TaxID=3100987 RepID=UPI003B00D952
MEFGIDIFLILFTVAFVAGLVDTIAGGGGLLTIPALLYTGLPPAVALATNKLQSTFGSGTAAAYFIKKKMVDINKMKLMILCTFMGAFAGGFALLQIDASILKEVIPILLVIIGFYFLLSPNIGALDKEKRITIVGFSFTLALGVGFYDGFFGPGTGSFFAIGFVALLGFNLTKATAHAKILNFISNISSLCFFMFFGKIYWSIGLCMGAGQMCGALIGARLVLKNGQKIIRPIIVIISFAMSIKLLVS